MNSEGLHIFNEADLIKKLNKDMSYLVTSSSSLSLFSINQNKNNSGINFNIDDSYFNNKNRNKNVERLFNKI